MKPFIKQRRSRQLTRLLAFSLGIILFCTQSVAASKVTSSCRPQIVVSELTQVDVAGLGNNCENPRDRLITPSAAIRQLAKADVVYLGENHNRAEDHKTQLQIIQALQQRQPKIAIAMEMFQRPYQPVLDNYLAGKLSEQELVRQSEYNQRWGFPWEFYAPILRFAQEKQLPVLALNTPSEVTRQVASAGLESLTPQQQQFIPPASEIRTDNDEYRQRLQKVFQQHQTSGHGSSRSFERFFLAQVLWDETMAAEVAKFLRVKPDYLVVVLAGQGHIVYGYGIPSRVARRLKEQKLVQHSVLLNLPQGESFNHNQVIADFIWQS